MGIEALIRGGQLAQSGASCLSRQLTPEEIEEGRKQAEEYERKRVEREIATIRFVLQISFFRAAIERGEKDKDHAWVIAGDTAEYLLGKFDGVTPDMLEPYSIINALRLK